MFGGKGLTLQARCSDLHGYAPCATQRAASYLAPELHGGAAGVKSGVTNLCRMRETTEVWASEVRVRP